ncbi:hypothetical protein PFISCL1PPCAC_25344, partial [Pristionchus fissidentatus]
STALFFLHSPFSIAPIRKVALQKSGCGLCGLLKDDRENWEIKHKKPYKTEKERAVLGIALLEDQPYAGATKLIERGLVDPRIWLVVLTGQENNAPEFYNLLTEKNEQSPVFDSLKQKCLAFSKEPDLLTVLRKRGIPELFDKLVDKFGNSTETAKFAESARKPESGNIWTIGYLTRRMLADGAKALALAPAQILQVSSRSSHRVLTRLRCTILTTSSPRN